jgi:hypothetical protein
LCTSFSIRLIRFDNCLLLHFGQAFSLVAAAFSILMVAVFNHVLLAGGPLLRVVFSRIVGWLTL